MLMLALGTLHGTQYMEGDRTFFMQLHNLHGASKETIDTILSTLWITRKTGLSPPDKSHLQSLLQFPSTSELDPVVACLRSVIRKCVHEGYTEERLLKLFPSDLGSDLRSSILLVLNRYQSQWREELSQEQRLLLPANRSSQLRTCNLPTSANFTSIEAPISTYQDDPTFDFRRCAFGSSMPGLADCNGSSLAQASLQNEIGSLEQPEIMPHLKSMTWTVENCKAPVGKVAVVTFKLHDYSRTPLVEKEVKFQITIDMLEVMLRSMTYINEKLSSMVGTSSEPSQKKQKQ